MIERHQLRRLRITTIHCAAGSRSGPCSAFCRPCSRRRLMRHLSCAISLLQRRRFLKYHMRLQGRPEALRSASVCSRIQQPWSAARNSPRNSRRAVRNRFRCRLGALSFSVMRVWPTGLCHRQAPSFVRRFVSFGDVSSSDSAPKFGFHCAENSLFTSQVPAINNAICS